MNIKKTANLLINFTTNRIAEVLGILIFSCGILLLIALLTYSPEDPNFIFPENTEIKNILGFQGSFISDLFFQSFGLIAYLISITYIFTGLNIIKRKEILLLVENTFFIILYILVGSLFFSFYYKDSFSFHINGTTNVSKGSGDQYWGRNSDYYMSVHNIRILNLAQGDTVKVRIQLHGSVNIEGSGGSDRCNWQGYLMA